MAKGTQGKFAIVIVVILKGQFASIRGMEETSWI